MGIKGTRTAFPTRVSTLRLHRHLQRRSGSAGLLKARAVRLAGGGSLHGAMPTPLHKVLGNRLRSLVGVLSKARCARTGCSPFEW